MDDDQPTTGRMTGMLVLGILILIVGGFMAAGGYYGVYGPPKMPLDGIAGQFLMAGCVAPLLGSALIICALTDGRLCSRSGSSGASMGMFNSSGNGDCSSGASGGDGGSCGS